MEFFYGVTYMYVYTFKYKLMFIYVFMFRFSSYINPCARASIPIIIWAGTQMSQKKNISEEEKNWRVLHLCNVMFNIKGKRCSPLFLFTTYYLVLRYSKSSNAVQSKLDYQTRCTLPACHRNIRTHSFLSSFVYNTLKCNFLCWKQSRVSQSILTKKLLQFSCITK